MAGGEIRVTFGELSAAQSSITSTSNSVNGLLGDLRSYLAPLEGGWEGAASGAYQALQQQWNTSAEELNRVLNQIGIAVGQAAENYQSTESSNQARFPG